MGVGENIELRNHIIGFKEEINLVANKNKDAFFTWFNDSKNADSTFIRGSWDFIYHIAYPLSSYLSKPEEKIALEIGYGGGRILAAASKSFKKVIGIDIHENMQVVHDELHSRGFNNFELFQTDGKQIPIQDNSIDIVYSFIVLQHVEKIDIFKHYIKETYRILKPGGIAILYFGRKRFIHSKNFSFFFYTINCLLERLLFPKGYKEIKNKVNCTNLFVTLWYAKKIVKKLNLKVLKQLVSRKQVPDGSAIFGGQHGLLVKKNSN